MEKSDTSDYTKERYKGSVSLHKANFFNALLYRQILSRMGYAGGVNFIQKDLSPPKIKEKQKSIFQTQIAL